MTEHDENNVERIVIERTEITRIEIPITDITPAENLYADDNENLLDRVLKSIIGRTHTI